MADFKLQAPSGGSAFCVGVSPSDPALVGLLGQGWKVVDKFSPLEVCEARLKAMGEMHLVTLREASRIAKVDPERIKNEVPWAEYGPKARRVSLGDLCAFIRSKQSA